MDIIDGTRIKSSFDNSIGREYFIESLSVRYFTKTKRYFIAKLFFNPSLF